MGTTDDVVRRSMPARLGIASLNLLTPGLGLLRLDDRFAALVFLAAVPLAICMVALTYRLFPDMSAGALATIISLILLGYLIAVAWTAIASFQKSRYVTKPVRWWSRWYVLIALSLAIGLAIEPLGDIMRGYYRNFYIPSESMRPTLNVGDRFVATASGLRDIRPGQVVVFRRGAEFRVSRIVATEGSRVVMRDGVPIINGVAASQRRVAAVSRESCERPFQAILLTERLPGEEKSHQILDLGESEIDNFPEAVVPSGHVFLLGDNRDCAADSRIEFANGGVGMVSINALVGEPRLFYWRGRE